MNTESARLYVEDLKQYYDIDQETEEALLKLNLEQRKQLVQIFVDEYEEEDGEPIYENAGNFMFTVNEQKYRNRPRCCGIYEDEMTVGGVMFYYGFDYGH